MVFRSSAGSILAHMHVTRAASIPQRRRVTTHVATHINTKDIHRNIHHSYRSGKVAISIFVVKSIVSSTMRHNLQSSGLLCGERTSFRSPIERHFTGKTGVSCRSQGCPMSCFPVETAIARILLGATGTEQALLGGSAGTLNDLKRGVCCTLFSVT